MFASIYSPVRFQSERMETVSVTREFDTSASVVRETIRDADAFFRGVGFDVRRDGDVLTLAKQVAIKRVELTVRLRDDDAALAYEQVEGIFEEMRTRYVVTDADDGCRVTVETTFEPPTSGLGTFVNETVVRRLRRTELAELGTLVEGRSPTAEPTVEVAEGDGERE